MHEAFPVLPFRSELYQPAELFAGFDPDRPGSYRDTPDFAAYRSTWLPGGRSDRDIGMLRALHDQCITDARDELLTGARVVAIMGGHAMQRTDAAYRAVVGLAGDLTRAGFVVATGGGPGAMEAAHLGALFARRPTADLDDALRHLARAASFPKTAAHVVGEGGVVDETALLDLHAWQAPAFEILRDLPEDQRGRSLAVPTWFYGHEPPTPFASHLAKYFANAIREDGLLAVAVDGVVFSPGKAGTLQEIFQDACQNYYRTFHRRFSPMVFLDLDATWSATFPVLDLLRPLFGDEDLARHVLVDEDPQVLLRFLLDHDAAAGVAPARVRPAGPGTPSSPDLN
jgi:predicted Rossmann-fold nucleotide-binding protein